ncbi:MAG TPA: RidA family protein [Chryseosolibacter sp.]
MNHQYGIFLRAFTLSLLVTCALSCRPTKVKWIDPASTSYAQACEVTNPRRLVFVSGQIPVNDNNHGVPANFQEQCRTVWNNIKEQLDACDMKLTDIVKVTTYLADRKYREQNYSVRQEVLGEHSPALTVIIADIYDEAWLLEIEVIAVH